MVMCSTPVTFNIGMQTKFKPKMATQALQTETDGDTPQEFPAGSPDPNNDIMLDYNEGESLDPASPVIEVIKTKTELRAVKPQTLLLIPPLANTLLLNVKTINVPLLMIVSQ